MILYLRTILRARWLLVLAAALAGAWLGYRLDHRHALTHTVYGQIELPPARTLRRTSNQDPDLVGGFLEEVPLVASDRILNRIVADLKLTQSSQFLGFAPDARTVSARNEVRLFAVARLRAQLRVTNVPGTTLGRIEYTGPETNLAISIVNAAMNDYIADRYERRYTAAQEKSLQMAMAMADLRQQVNEMQEQLLRLQQEIGAPGFTPRNNPYEATLRQLESRSTAAQLARFSAEAEAETLRTDASSASPNQPTLNSLRLQLSAKRSEEAQLRTELGPKHPEVEGLEAANGYLQAQIEAEYQIGLQAADARIELAKAYEDELASAVTAHKGNMAALRNAVAHYANLEREYVFARRLYLANFERLRTREMNAALLQNDIFIVGQAVEVPFTSPVPDWLAILSGGLLGTLLALATGFLANVVPSPFERLARLETLSGAPVLATIPDLGRADLPGWSWLISSKEPQRSGAVEEFVQGIFDLRIQLQVQQPRYLLFTSALPAEGKTTVSGSLAVAMARRGAKVLLIDADLRRPTVHRQFGLTTAIGVTSVLSGKVALQQAVQSIAGTDQLDILTSGPLPPDPSSTLASAAMLEMLRCAGELYSTVILDSPPVLATSDALALSQWMDATVWVIRDGKAGRSTLLRARQLMENYGTRPLGIIVNGIASDGLRLSDPTPALEVAKST